MIIKASEKLKTKIHRENKSGFPYIDCIHYSSKSVQQYDYNQYFINIYSFMKSSMRMIIIIFFVTQSCKSTEKYN